MATYEIKLNEKTKIGKEIFLFLQQHNVKMKLKEKEKTKMTKEEFDAKCARVLANYERGEYTVFNSEDFRKKYGLD